MKKADCYLGSRAEPYICFLFACILAFLAVILYFDYVSIKAIHQSDLQQIGCVEGIVTHVETPKTNTDVTVDGSDKEFYIHTSDLKGNTVKTGDSVVIYCAKNSPIRGNYYNIVQLTLNGETVYTLEEYKSSNNPSQYLGLCIGSSCGVLALVILGFILLIKYKGQKTDGIKWFLLANKDKFDFTEEQIDEIAKSLEESKKPQSHPSKSENEIYQMFRDSIYIKNNRTYTSGLELIETEEYGDIFFKVLGDTAAEGELKVIYDDGYTYEDAIYVIYKINSKTAVLQLFWEEDTKRFQIDRNTLYFTFGRRSKPTKEEEKQFFAALDRYNLRCENIFDLRLV